MAEAPNDDFIVIDTPKVSAGALRTRTCTCTCIERINALEDYLATEKKIRAAQFDDLKIELAAAKDNYRKLLMYQSVLVFSLAVAVGSWSMNYKN